MRSGATLLHEIISTTRCVRVILTATPKVYDRHLWLDEAVDRGENRESLGMVKCHNLRISNLEQSASSLHLLDFLSFRDAAKPIKEHGGCNIKHNIDPQQTKVPPACIPIGMNALQELVGVVHLAVLTFTRSLGIAKKTACSGDVVSHVLGARLIRRCKESLEFGSVAMNRCLS
jgi:hypothetical protein